MTIYIVVVGEQHEGGFVESVHLTFDSAYKAFHAKWDELLSGWREVYLNEPGEVGELYIVGPDDRVSENTHIYAEAGCDFIKLYHMETND